MTRRVYIIIGKYGTDCFSNLSKLIRAYPLFTYHPIYDALHSSNTYIKGDYTIIKTILQ